MSDTPKFNLYLGVDVSKGYADLDLRDAEGRPLGLQGQYDDTPTGHTAVRAALQQAVSTAQARGAAPGLAIGVEASGGLERNWLKFFLTFSENTLHQVYLLNPLAVKRFRAQDLHRSSTDALSAEAIAEYLRCGRRKTRSPHADAESGVLVFYRATCSSIRRLAVLKNQLQVLLPSVHPDLVQYCQKKLPGWVLTLLAQYPTAAQLANAPPATVAQIPYVTAIRAVAVVEDAACSVGALQDAFTAATITQLVWEIQHLDRQIEGRKQLLAKHLGEDSAWKLLHSIPAIGTWTATVLRLEIGDFHRFYSAAALVAYAGLDPAYFESGDGRVEWHISKQGRSQLRAQLWLSAFSGLCHNPVLKAYYDRLVDAGKRGDVALVATAAKLLRIAYACVISDQPFDPEYGTRLPAQHAQRTAAQATPSVAATETDLPRAQGALNAPVSRREKQRRKALAGGVAASTPADRPEPQATPGAGARFSSSPDAKGRQNKGSQRATTGTSPKVRGHAATLATHDNVRRPREPVALK